MAQDLDESEISGRVLDHLSTAALLTDKGMKILFTNQAAENLLQESHAHMKNRCLSEVIANGTDLAELTGAALASNRLYTRRQMTLLLPGRADVTADVTVTPVMEAGQVLIELVPMDRYLRIDRDAAIKMHHDATRQMVRGLAHEIKNPLGGIKGSAQLLAKELSGESKEYTDIIIEETDRLTSLLDRMLGPSVAPKKKPTNIHELLEKIRRLIELESGGGLVVSRDYDPSIPELTLDPELMLQALLNIARNAIQCLEGNPHPAVTLATRVERQFTISGGPHKMVLQIAISDNGPGIPEDIKEHLFYPMISRRPGGTGLGLTFAQAIIRRHDGMIEFTSRPGETVFRIFIPLERV